MLDIFFFCIIFYLNIFDLYIDFVIGCLLGKKLIWKKDFFIYRYIFFIDMVEI